MTTEERNKMVLENIGLVFSAFKRCMEKIPSLHRVGEPEDFVQEGIMTLMKCAERFDVSKGCKFSTYVFPSICKAMKRMFETRGLIRTPRLKKGLVDKTLKRYRSKARGWYSLSMTETHNGPRGFRISQLPDHDAEDLCHDTENELPMIKAHRLTSRILNPRRREALYLYFIEDLPLWEVGQEMGVSKERARQLVNAALNEIRKTLAMEEE